MYIQAENISKSYGEKETAVQVLRGVSFRLDRGKICVILGASGSGKSTLLNVIGGLENVDEGTIRIGGEEITAMKPAELADYRRNQLGFVFQFYNLIPGISQCGKISRCAGILQTPRLTRKSFWRHWGCLNIVESFLPSSREDSSRGVPSPVLWLRISRLLLCDEPTGALDIRDCQGDSDAVGADKQKV